MSVSVIANLKNCHEEKDLMEGACVEQSGQHCAERLLRILIFYRISWEKNGIACSRADLCRVVASSSDVHARLVLPRESMVFM